ncbi:MAG: HEAT repeat domain-containing protein, partial [Planctomycetota bacterium]|nr:HEAT repeat domain-containing protein [Planctomycetota bacterium]
MVLLLAAAAAADDVVTAKLAWESGYVIKIHAHRIAFDAKPPAQGPSGLRGGTYGTLPLLGKKVLVAFGDGRFWVDADADGSFEGERPFYTEGAAWNLVRTIVVDGEPLVLRFYSSGKDIRYSPRSYRLGNVALAGRLRTVALSDHNGDLLFDAKDHLYVDIDGDGVFDEIKPGRPVRIGNRGFVAAIVDPKGGAVEFRTSPTVPPAPSRTWKPYRLAGPRSAASKPKESLEQLKRTFADLDSKLAHEYYPVINKIAGLQSGEAFELLWDIANGDRLPAVRGQAAKAMGYAAYREHRDRIRRLLKNRTPAVVAGALEALHGIDDEDREAVFLGHVSSNDAAVVQAAARGLAYLHTEAGFNALVKVYGRAGNERIRYSAYDGLRYWPQGPPVAIALRAADDSYASLRARAIEDLWRLGHPDARRLALKAADGTPSVTEQYAIIRVLKTYDDKEAVQTVLAMASSASTHVRKRVLEALRPLRSPAAIAAIVAALRAKEPAVRTLAAEVLAGIDDAQVAAALARQARRERDESARDAVIDALGDHADPSSIPLLLKLAKRKNLAAIRALARFGLGEPRVRAFFLRLLDSRRWENRVYALDAAGLSGQESMVKRVASNLGHDEWRVRLAGAEALGKLRFKASIPPLIERLGPEKHRRVRAALADSLWKLTGKSFLDMHEPWRRWWAQHGKSFVVPKRIPERVPLASAATVASFFGLPVFSDNVVFVVDKSGSMSAVDRKTKKGRLEMAADEVLAAVGRLKDRDAVGVVFFDSGVQPWEDRLVKLTRTRRANLQAYVKK